MKSKMDILVEKIQFTPHNRKKKKKKIWNYYINFCISRVAGARGSLVVKALSYKPKGRGFETQWGEILNLPNPPGRTRPWGLLSL
jgi:hypothetical protein